MKASLKLAAILISIGLLMGGVVGSTVAFFRDTASSPENTFQAGTLDLTARDTPTEVAWEAENLLPGDEVEKEIKLTNSGSISIQNLEISVEVE